jgi:heme/copper-type cytochrome/quinol oxidase subunit 2
VKVAWMLALIFLPIVGLLVYVIVRGRGMSARSHAT